MVWIPGGTFVMGSDAHYPEEAPAHPVTVSGFWIDRTRSPTPPSAASSRRPATSRSPSGCRTRRTIPGRCPRCWWPARSSSRQPPGRVPMGSHYAWWDWMPGADWRHPGGSREHPQWPGAPPGAARRLGGRRGLRRLGRQGDPDRGGVGVRRARRARRLPYAWGEELAPKGKMLANYWQGEFPWQNLALDGYERTAPVGSFPPNGYGLFDMIGNAWEWTADWYTARHEMGSPCCGAAVNPRGGSREGSVDPRRRGGHPAQGAQGRLLGLRRELLPALPSGRAHAPPDRHRHQPHQLPLRRATGR